MFLAAIIAATPTRAKMICFWRKYSVFPSFSANIALDE